MKYDIYRDSECAYYAIKENEKVSKRDMKYVGTIERNGTFRSLSNNLTLMEADNEFECRYIKNWDDYTEMEKLAEQYHKDLAEDNNDEEGYVMCLYENFIPIEIEYDGNNMIELHCEIVREF